MTAVPLTLSNCPCRDCGMETLPVDWGYRAEYYMVKNEIWDTVGPGWGYLCVGCLESRMGRKLNADDFIDAPVNDLGIADTQRFAWSYRTPRLKSRLANHGE
jgi:hypothetical protein